MTKKNSSIDRLATATTRQAQSEIAMMQRDIGKLRDSVSGLTRSITTPVIKPSRARAQRTTNTSLLGEVLGLTAAGGLSALGIGGGSSVSQQMGSLLSKITLGQRIR